MSADSFGWWHGKAIGILQFSSKGKKYLPIDKKILPIIFDIMEMGQQPIAAAADRLAEMYGQSFGGKPKGRYRIPVKLVCQLAGRRRLYEDDTRDLTRAMLERGYVLIDMNSFFVVMSANMFVNYRRANKACIE